jgi:hypothetical protein
MSNKQTAVEWLYERLERMIPRDAIYNMDKQEYFKQAKQMEKKQMIEFADRYGFDVCHFDYDRADEYYELTYKQQEND